jgi:hypothetical protein
MMVLNRRLTLGLLMKPKTYVCQISTNTVHGDNEKKSIEPIEGSITIIHQ